MDTVDVPCWAYDDKAYIEWLLENGWRPAAIVSQHGKWKKRKAFVDRVYNAWCQRERRRKGTARAQR